MDNRFSSIYEAWQEYGAPDLSETWLGHLWHEFLDTQVEFELTLLDQSLGQLLLRFTLVNLDEQMTALFDAKNPGQREKAFRKANTELLAMAEFDRVGILLDLGWLAEKYGNSPPFDFRLSASGVPIPVDVKDANGSGLREAKKLLEKILGDWLKEKNLTPCRVDLRYQGVISQKRVTDTLYKTDAGERFTRWLKDHAGIPKDPFPFLLEDPRLINGRPQTPPTRLIAVVVPIENAAQQSGGVQRSDFLADVLSDVLESHVEEKAESAHLEGDTPFLLVYVKLPNYGASDFKTAAAFRDATTLLSGRARTLGHNADALWLGSVFIHTKGNTMEHYCCLRTSAAWPLGLDPETLATNVGGPLTKI